MSEKSIQPLAPRQIGRRTVLKGTFGGMAALTLAPWSAPVRASQPAVERIAERFFLLSGAGGNVLALPTEEGRVLVDSGAAEAGEELMRALSELPGEDRVHTLFNTHWHLDQVGSNEAIGRGGATIVAHEKTRWRLATGYYLWDEERYQEPLPEAAHPTQSFFSRKETRVGGERIEYGHLLLAHTDGDMYVYFRDANVLAVGCAVSPERDPELDWFGGGWIGGRVEALELLLALSDDDTVFVPGYGPAVGRAEVQAEHGVMLELFERMVELVRQGLSAEDCLAAGVMDGLGREWNDPLTFIDAAHRSLWAHHNKLSHDIV